MSGFEIAGVVLGAFPIALEALKQYHNVARTWGFWWEIRGQYSICSNSIKYQRLLFERNLKSLLLSLLIADDDQIKQLMANPGGEKWKEQEIAQQLEDRLRDSYELYLEIIREIQRTIEKLNHELAVDKTGVQETLASDGVSKLSRGVRAQG